MAFLRDNEEIRIKKSLVSFLKKKFHGKVTCNKEVFPNFAPDYHVKQGNNKQRIVIFRNPPTIPEIYLNEIKLAITNGIGVYIAVYNHEYQKLLKDFLSKCETLSIGVLQYGTGQSKFSRILPSITDYPPPDKIEEGLIKVFISSKLWISEREAARQKIIRLRHQQICVERLTTPEKIEEECIKWVEESQYCIGIITPAYSKLVDKEIRHAIKTKPKRTLVYIRADCFVDPEPKLSQLIKYIKQEATFEKFDTYKKVGDLIKKQLPETIGKNSK